MSILAILEVAVGMIFVWLVMSLAGMYIQELIVSKLKWRSELLESHISNLMSDPGLARQFYDHPLIQGLHSGTDGENKPAYIPSAQFSMALLDIILTAPKEASLIQNTLYELQLDINQLPKNNRKLAQKQLEQAISQTRKASASDGGEEMVNAILDDVKKQIRKLSTDFPQLQPAIEAKFLNFAAQKKQIDIMLASQIGNSPSTNGQVKPIQEQFKTGLAVFSITHPNIKQAIDALINDLIKMGSDTENNLLVIQKRLEDWFNNSMDRLSGWYKRRAQTLAFFIGISLAIVLNVDSLQLVNQLWRDPSVRQAISAQADALVNNNPNGISSVDAGTLLALNAQINQLNIPVGWIGTGLPSDSSGAVFVGDGTQLLCTLSPKSSVNIFGILLGNECYPIINTPRFNDLAGWLLKLFGLLITGLAAAQGAPFWFDTLKNFINVRLAGINSDSTQK